MKFKSFGKFLAVLTLLIQFVMIPKMSYADTNERQEIESGATYKIITALNDSSLLSYGVTNEGRRTFLFHDTDSKDEKWKIYYDSDKKAYRIESIAIPDNGQPWQLVWLPQSNDDSFVSVLNNNYDRANYNWIFEDAGNGYYYMKNLASSKYLDVQREKTDDFTNIIAYTYNGGYNQKFKLQKIN